MGSDRPSRAKIKPRSPPGSPLRQRHRAGPARRDASGKRRVGRICPKSGLRLCDNRRHHGRGKARECHCTTTYQLVDGRDDVRLCKRHLEVARNTNLQPEPPRAQLPNATVAKAVLAYLHHFGCSPEAAFLRDEVWQPRSRQGIRAVYKAANVEVKGMRENADGQRLLRALEWYGANGGFRARVLQPRAHPGRFQVPVIPGWQGHVECYVLQGFRAPLVIHHGLLETPARAAATGLPGRLRRVVDKHFTPHLIEAARGLQTVDKDSSGSHRFLTTHRAARRITPDEVKRKLRGARRALARGEGQHVEDTLRLVLGAIDNYLAEVRETVIDPYLRHVGAPEFLQADRPLDGFLLDYHAASGADRGSGLGAHTDASTWTLLTVLPALQGEDWEGCELLFNYDHDLQPQEGGRLQRLPVERARGAPEKGASDLRIRPIGGAEPEEVWGLVLRPGDVVCQPGGLEHAVADLRRPTTRAKPRRQSLALFMGLPVGRDCYES